MIRRSFWCADVPCAPNIACEPIDGLLAIPAHQGKLNHTSIVRRAFALDSTYHIHETSSIQSFLIMSVNDIDIKKHAEMAATVLICAPVLKVPQAMRATEFAQK